MFENEHKKCAVLYKKYKRCVNITDTIDKAPITITMWFGMGGIGLLATIIAVLIVDGMESGALACGFLGLAGWYVSKKLTIKVKKHDQIRTLAKGKISSNLEIVSKALTDVRRNDPEFKLVLDEIDAYKELTEKQQTKVHKAASSITINEEAKQELVKQYSKK